MKISLLLLVSICSLCLLSACGGGTSANSGGGGGGGGNPQPNPTVTISASSNTITLGLSVTLTWSSANATSCTASANPNESDWSGSEPISGSQSVTPTSPGVVVYTLMCTGTSGSSPGSTSVTANTSSNLTISSGPLSDGTVGVPYGQSHSVKVPPNGPVLHGVFFQLTASGGTGSLSWTWAAAPGSSLPPGLQCCDDVIGMQFPPIHVLVQGAIAGVPTAPGTYHVVVTVAESASPAVQAKTAE